MNPGRAIMYGRGITEPEKISAEKLTHPDGIRNHQERDNRWYKVPRELQFLTAHPHMRTRDVYGHADARDRRSRGHGFLILSRIFANKMPPRRE